MGVERGSAKEPARLVFRYFAWTDKMCNAVTQEYLVYWEAAKDAGVVQRPAVRRGQAPF